MFGLSPTMLLVAVLALLGASGSGFLAGRHMAEGSAAIAAGKARSQYDADLETARSEKTLAETNGRQMLADAAAAYEKLIKGKDDELATAVAKSRTATGGMYLHTTCPPAIHSGVPEAQPGTSGSNGGTPIRLSGQDAEFLLRFGAQCDAVADELRLAQQVIVADRKVCGEGQ